jgi:Protein of unknown function (DUF982)
LLECPAQIGGRHEFFAQEDIVNDRPFSVPVEIVLGSEHKCIVASVWEGMEFLSQHRPDAPGPRYRAALRICRDALDGWLPVVKARRAFVAAAREAHLLAKR